MDKKRDKFTVVEAIVEIPKGSRNKYEFEHEKGYIRLDRVLFTSVHFPSDYGFVPGTKAPDGDPLDILILIEEPTFSGCHVMVRPIGVLVMQDEAGIDEKIISVPVSDPRFEAVGSLNDMAPHWRIEIENFFSIYKELEAGKHARIKGWEGVGKAKSLLKKYTVESSQGQGGGFMDAKKIGNGIVESIRNNPLPVTLIGLGMVWLAFEKMASKESQTGEIHLEEAVTIDRPPDVLYQFWRRLNNLPQLFSHIETVRILDATRSRWVARAPLGIKIQWEAEVFNDIPNQEIHWRSVEGSVLETIGAVFFRKAPGNRGTEVKASFSYTVPAGRVGAAFSKVIGLNPAAEIREGLRHFKQLMEAGEIPLNLRHPHAETGREYRPEA
jgi:inorganic pyrophosphatase